MKEFTCLRFGCDTVIHGESDDEVLEKAAVHARDDHGMDEVPPEVQDSIRAAIIER